MVSPTLIPVPVSHKERAFRGARQSVPACPVQDFQTLVGARASYFLKAKEVNAAEGKAAEPTRFP